MKNLYFYVAKSSKCKNLFDQLFCQRTFRLYIHGLIGDYGRERLYGGFEGVHAQTVTQDAAGIHLGSTAAWGRQCMGCVK